jgi:beta-galactosidase
MVHHPHRIMRRLVFLATAFPILAFAEAPDWENPAVFRRDKLPARATSMAFPDRQASLETQRLTSPWCLTLNGPWKFHYSGNVAGAPAAFEKPETDVSSWAEITVPSNWQLRGYGIPIYSGNIYPFAKSPPSVTAEPPAHYTSHSPENRHPIGSYRRTFTLPDDWKERRTLLTFEGVDSAFDLWINGEKAGYSEDSRTTAEFDISSKVKPGENTIAVQVHQYSDGSYLESQNTWKLSGIYRDVYLSSIPTTELQDHWVQAGLAAIQSQGVLRVFTKLKNHGTAVSTGKLSLELIAPDGNTVITKEVPYDLEAEATASVEIDAGLLSNIQPWSAEQPVLYSYLLTILDGSGQPLAVYPGKTGFRHNEIRDGVLLHNGKPIRLKGVVRHDHHQQNGRAVPTADLRQELVMMKRANLNAVRFDHAPPSPQFLDLCDELGLYVISEPNLDTSGMGDDSLEKDPAWQSARLDRVQNLFERDKNHPSIIAWSGGFTATGYLPTQDRTLTWLLARDPTRPVIDNTGSPKSLAGLQWLTPEAAAELAKSRKNDPTDANGPAILASYNRALGNSSGRFNDYAELFRKEQTLQGGFIVSWRDETLLKKSTGDDTKPGPLRISVAHGGDFGDQPNAGTLCASGVLTANLSPTATFEEIRRGFQDIRTELSDGSTPIVKLWVYNDQVFTGTENLKASWKLLKDGKDVAQGAVAMAPIGAGQNREIQIVTGAKPDPNAEFMLRVRYDFVTAPSWSSPGMPVAWDEIPLPWGKRVAPDSNPSANPASFTVEGNEIRISAGEVSAVIDRRNGFLTSLKRKNEEVLVAPLHLDFWRTPTAADKIRGLDESLDIWKEAGGKTTARKVDVNQDEQQVVVIIEVDIPAGKSSATLVYRFSGEGEIAADVTFQPDQTLPAPPRIGLSCAVPPGVNKWTWFGKGPHENYPDRQRGAWTAIHTGLSNQLIPRYSVPQEAGNRMDVRWATFEPAMGGNGFRFDATGDSLLQFSASPASPEGAESEGPGPRPKPDRLVFHLDHYQAGLGSADPLPAQASASAPPSPKERYQWSLRLTTLHATPPPIPPTPSGAGARPLPPGFPEGPPAQQPDGTQQPRPRPRPKAATPEAPTPPPEAPKPE